MARYVAKYARYVFTARPNREMVLADGQRQELQSALHCRFQPWDVTEYEFDKALETFKFKGMPSAEAVIIDGQYGEPVTDPRYRLSSFDTSTQGWTEEDEEFVINRLDSHSDNGTDFIRVDPPALQPPWPNYDQLVAGGRGKTNESVAAEIVRLVGDLGLDAEDVAHYERLNRNRKEVLDALAQVGVEDKPEVVEVAA